VKLPSPAVEWSVNAIRRVEQIVYIAVGVTLILALLVTLVGSVAPLAAAVQDVTDTSAIFRIVDRLLFVLMLVEILHTVHASIRSGNLVSEPFLIVGLIASVRRILVITLETSEITRPDRWNDANLPLFHASMIELSILAAMIAILVASIRVVRVRKHES
jgi:uncharacterized membrane protein (DUF373 family)